MTTDSNKLTLGEMLAGVEKLKALGVCKGRIACIEFEFTPTPIELPWGEGPQKHYTPEELEDEAAKLRKQMAEEEFAAS